MRPGKGKPAAAACTSAESSCGCRRVAKYGSVFASSIYGFPVVFLTNFKARDRVAEGIHKDTLQFQPPSFLALMGNHPQGAVAAGFVKADHQAMVRTRCLHRPLSVAEMQSFLRVSCGAGKQQVFPARLLPQPGRGALAWATSAVFDPCSVQLKPCRSFSPLPLQG